MFRFRPRALYVVILCISLLCTLAPSAKLGATPPLTTISDTLFNADGSFFNGVVVISWPSFEASDTSNVAAEITTFHRVVGPLRHTPGGRLLWGSLPSARDVRIDAVIPIRTGTMTEASASGRIGAATLEPSED